MGKIKFTTLIIILTYNLNAQSKISGLVKNVKNELINSASVILRDNTGEILLYTYTDEFGRYNLKTDETGKLFLIISSFEYEQKENEILIEFKNQILTQNFILVAKTTVLKEVIIESKRQIKIKNDTIIFSADSFKQGNEQTVEDLLKKIPGLNIDANGTIKVGNQEVEKVMIDGDDIFEKGYKILTKNMPVNPIDKIELYQNYSNNKHLKDIENSNKVALNLTLKEDAKRIWFGNMQVAYGLILENRYKLGSNLMNFGKKNKYYFLTNFNNIGEDATGEINNLIRPKRFNEPASIGDDQSVNSLLGLGFETPNLKQKRTNLNNA